MVVGRLVFDFARHSVEKTIRVKQFDSETRNLLVVLLNDGEPYEMPEGAIVRIECRKSDGEEILNDCTYVENLVTAEITEQMTAAAGYAECAISVYEKESYIASWTFNLKIDTAVIVGDKIASTIEYKAIINALQEVEKSKDIVVFRCLRCLCRYVYGFLAGCRCCFGFFFYMVRNTYSIVRRSHSRSS